MHDIDSHVGVGLKLAKESSLFITVDTFNLWNFQGVTAYDQTYTQDQVLPIEGGTKKDLSKLQMVDRTPVPRADRNPNFGRPTRYQEPRTFQFGAKVTF